MILFLVLHNYIKDVKKFGKEKLEVSLKERLTKYFTYICIPIILVILTK